MLTFFTTTKPCKGNMAVIQRNAIESWRVAAPNCPIHIFSDAPGTDALASQTNCTYHPKIDSFENRVPYVDALFRDAEKAADTSVLCYINADIILPPEFLKSIQPAFHLKKFLMIGYRHDMDGTQSIDFDSPESVQAFWSQATKHGVKHAPTGIDYFVFTKGLWKQIPRFIIGRMAWDNWLIWQARRQFVPVIDATSMVQAIHQNHDYNLVENGEQGVRNGAPTQRNIQLLKKRWAACTLLDAHWELFNGALHRKTSSEARDIYYDRLWRIFPEIAYPLIALAYIRRLINAAIIKR